LSEIHSFLDIIMKLFHRREILLSMSSAGLGYLVANAIELTAIRMVHPSEQALTWVSDALLASAFGVVTYLWLHLKAARVSLSRLERARIEIDTELSLAAEIQRNNMPVVPSPHAGLRWAARLQQAERIGGDFYDFVQPNPHTQLFLLGDISGKGIPAALLLASTRTLFRTLCHKSYQPAELLDSLSVALYEENGGSMFMTCLLGLFDLKCRTLTFVNAGHPPGLILVGARRQLLQSGGVPAGMFPSWTYTSKTVLLQPGSIGIFMTDGISEAVGGDVLESADLIERVVSKIPRPVTPERVCERLVQLAKEGGSPTGDGEREDDQTVLAFVLDEQGGEGDPNPAKFIHSS
jgi:phosphoserine phosphatase RsbU/P